MTLPAPRELGVIGIGQLGQLYAGGALRLGLRVTPLLRGQDRPAFYDALPPGTPLLLSLPEDALAGEVAQVPAARKDDVVLVQNELFPTQWRALGLANPTVLTVWLSKKKSRPVEVARATLAHGPFARLFVQIHEALGLPARVATDESELLQDIVAKYVFILTINALGLVENLTLGEWLKRDPEGVRALIAEAARLGSWHAGQEVPPERLTPAVLAAMEALHGYPARGRSAGERLARAQRDLAEATIAAPRLLEIARWCQGAAAPGGA